MNLTKNAKIRAGYEPFPGYVLERSIGSGGFGEVWQCTAPGGIKKAVKFVFGSQDGSQASREMKSLERMKGVRHPFLLTLERFEVIDDQLVILTELADESLEEVHENHKSSGACGVPRKQLLSHLHDVADGLDYLHSQYQLQHLDVKPANLLMVGGHVKVADFGLLKNIQDVETSVVGGLTPIYAPPEVFDGRPSQNSDQYSLAIVYQELLTGKRPYPGNTLAQLATQHLHAAPNLESLPPRDRPIVAKALEKDPSRRFDTCCEFIDSLIESKRRPSRAFSGTDSDGDLHSQEAASVANLPQINHGNASEDTDGCRHAIVIGIGGTGADCVGNLSIQAVAPENDGQLQLHPVIIDTDINSLADFRQLGVVDSLPTHQLILTELKTAHQYRRSGTQRLKTVSRRWIYNVPRSLTTENMRPLGRLALVDHGLELIEKLRSTFSSVAELAGSSKPLVYVVGSLAGGTGSGMYIDLVHLVRGLLDELDFADVRIRSIMTTARLQADPARPLALMNTHAGLIEIEHFMKAGNGYPGDPGAGFPSIPAARTPLHDLYVVAGSNDSRFGCSTVCTISDYVWADATNLHDVFEDARSCETDQQSIRMNRPALRTVGIVRLQGVNRRPPRSLDLALVQTVMKKWLGRKPGPLTRSPSPVVGLVKSIGMTPNGIADHVLNHPEEQLCKHWAKRLFSEIAMGLRRHQVDMSTALATLHQLQPLLENFREQLDPTKELLENDSKFISEISIEARPMICEQIGMFIDQMQDLISRMYISNAWLADNAISLDEAIGHPSPWLQASAELQQRQHQMLQRLHERTIDLQLLKPIQNDGLLIDPEASLDAMIEMARVIVNNVSGYESPSDSKSSATLPRTSVAGVPYERPKQPCTHNAIASAEQTGTHSLETHTETQESDDQSAANRTLNVTDAIEVTRPELLRLGGQQRVLLVVKDQADRELLEPKLREEYGDGLSVVLIADSKPMLVHEGQSIEIKNVLDRMGKLNGDTSEVISRLSSRNDIKW